MKLEMLRKKDMGNIEIEREKTTICSLASLPNQTMNSYLKK